MNKLLLFLGLALFFGITNPARGQVPNNQKNRPDSAAQVKAYLASIKLFTQALNGKYQTTGSRASLYMMRATTEAKLNYFGKAVSDFTAAITISPGVGELYLNRGLIYERINEDEKAVDDYRKALSLFPVANDRSAVVYNQLALVEGKMRHYEKAVAADSMAILISPKYGAAYANQGENYARLKNYRQAINNFSIAMYGFQDNAMLLARLFAERADMKRALKQRNEAIADYSMAIKLNPGLKLAYWNRASVYFANRDYELATDDYNKAIVYYKGDNKQLSRLYDDRAMMEIGQQQFKQAIADDSLAISLDTAYEVAYWNKANAHAQNGDFKLSNKIYRKVLWYYPANSNQAAQLYTNIAHNEYFLNDFNADANDCTSAIEIKPGFAQPYMERGRAYLKLNKNDLALSDFKQVLALDTIHSSDYAFALYYTGSGDKAIDIMQSNIIATTDTYALTANYYNMACLFALMNKKDDANAYLKKCIDGGYPKIYAIADSDLDNIRNTEEFKNIVSVPAK